MSKDEYIKQLKNNLLSLTEDEQIEAIQYYSDYFDEAQDDEKVISELGSPEELAKTIVEKFANVPVKTSAESNNDEDNADESSSVYDALYYVFNKEDVKSLAMNFGAAQVVAVSGNQFSIETRGLTKDNLNCYLSPEGNLIINNGKKINLNFFNHDRRSRIVPRILLTVPNGCNLNRFKLNLGAGSVEFRDVDMKCREGLLEVAAGNLVVKKLSGGKLNFRCGMGNLTFEGKIIDVCNVDCGMGNVTLNVHGLRSNFSYDVKLGLGDFRINDEKKSGICQYVSDIRKDNHFSVNCGMGNVTIKVEE